MVLSETTKTRWKTQLRRRKGPDVINNLKRRKLDNKEQSQKAQHDKYGLPGSMIALYNCGGRWFGISP